MRLTLPIKKFILQRLKEEFPKMDTRASSALVDLVVNPMALLTQPLDHEIQNIKLAQSMKNHRFLSEEQMDDLLFNLLVFRRQGTKAFGTIRIYFFETRDYQYNRLVFVTNSGLRFINSQPISITPQALAGNQDDAGTFFFDVQCESIETGLENAIANDEIVGLETPVPEIARVTNPFAFTKAESAENNQDVFARAQDAVIARTLINEYSIRSVLFNEFPFLRDIKILGAGSDGMTRDIVNVGGKNIHTYGKTDIYVDTSVIQENQVEISYVPEDAQIDIVGNNSSRIVFPIDDEDDTSSSGASRTLYFNDSTLNFNPDESFFNHILRIYRTEFGSDIYTDYVIKAQTPQNELLVVEDKTQEGDVIPYGNGWITLRTLVENHKDQYLFKGQNGNGSDLVKVSLNGPNNIYGIPLQTVSFDLFISASAETDSAIVAIVNTFTLDTIKHPLFVITEGDAVGAYDVVSYTANYLQVAGQIKDYNATTASAGATSTITLQAPIDRSAQVGDYVVVTDYQDAGKYLFTITAIDYDTKKVVLSKQYNDSATRDLEIHDGINGALETTEKCYIAQDDDYIHNTSYSWNYSGTLVTYGSGDDALFLLQADVLSTLHPHTGDRLTGFDGTGTPATNALILATFTSGSNPYLVIKGEAPFDFPNTEFKIESPNITITSPVIDGVFNFLSAGDFDITVNTIATGSGFVLVHPNIATGIIPNVSPKSHKLVNFTDLTTYDSSLNPFTTFGMNGIRFSGTSTFADGDQWAIFPSSERLRGGSTWSDRFSWFSSPSLESTSLAGTYPNTNPGIELIIAGGPNAGTYDVIQVTNSNEVLLDVELGEVSKVSTVGVFTGSYATGSTELLMETTSAAVAASAGQTLKITTGEAADFYRISSVSTGGIIIEQGIAGNVFGGIDSFEIIDDTYQPFFFIQTEEVFQTVTSTQYEIWTPLLPKRRVVEGTAATTDTAGKLTDTSKSFDVYFSGIPIDGAQLSFVDGDNEGSTVTLSTFGVSDGRDIFYSPSVSAAGNNKYQIYQDVLNLTQQSYNILNNFDYYNGTYFVIPILAISEISEIDPITSEVLSDPLIPNSDFFLYCRNDDVKTLRYSADERNIIKFADQHKFKAFRVIYKSDPSISLIHQFCTADVNRIANNDILVKRKETTIVDVDIELSNMEAQDAIDIINEYITNRGGGNDVLASDIVSLLYAAGADYINTESLKLTSFYLPPKTSPDNMWIANPPNRSAVSSPVQSTYLPGTISVIII